MNHDEVNAFLDQFDRSARNFARWPEWMRNNCHTASARLPSPLTAAAKARIDAMTPRQRATLQLQGGQEGGAA